MVERFGVNLGLVDKLSCNLGSIASVGDLIEVLFEFLA